MRGRRSAVLKKHDRYDALPDRRYVSNLTARIIISTLQNRIPPPSSVNASIGSGSGAEKKPTKKRKEIIARVQIPFRPDTSGVFYRGELHEISGQRFIRREIPAYRQSLKQFLIFLVTNILIGVENQVRMVFIKEVWDD